jgi:CBS-domain-containing membrane protein
MKTLELFAVDDINTLAHPTQNQSLDTQSSALQFFTDFAKVQPLVIERNASAVEARQLMLKTHVRMKIVVDEDNNFIGIVSADDLIERHIVQKVAQGIKREEVPLCDFVRSKNQLQALAYSAIENATIGDVIRALQSSGQQHCLVVDQEKGLIRGVFSASDISRQLHLPIDIQQASSFYTVFRAIHRA